VLDAPVHAHQYNCFFLQQPLLQLNISGNHLTFYQYADNNALIYIIGLLQNNCTETGHSFCRHLSQGTRSENGRTACERFFTVVAMYSRQCKSAFVFIKETIEKYCAGLPPPVASAGR
jgi:hypothetical protein